MLAADKKERYLLEIEDIETLCKYYNSSIGCRNNENCPFLHPVASTASILPEGSIFKKPSALYFSDNLDNASSNTSRVSNVPVSLDAMWGLPVEDSVYFYGAPGGLASTKIEATERSGPLKPSFASIVGQDNVPNSAASSSSNSSIKRLPKKTHKVCQFYLVGTCKFGGACRDLHSMLEENQSGSNAATFTSASNTSSTIPCIGAELSMECGICMGKPGRGEMYGVMSNCSCVFCLECIKAWRAEGMEVALKAEQVR